MRYLHLLYRVTRARTLPVMIAPVVIGSVLAWQQVGVFQWALFFLTLLGALAAHLGANVINDIFDFTAGTDQLAQEMTTQGTSFASGSQPLMSGTSTLTAYRALAFTLFGVALVCGLLLTLFRPLALVFGACGFVLAYFYVAPPLRLAYLGRGAGEVAIFFSFGIIPLLGAYYVQTGHVTVTALLAALPIGLYTTAVLYFHHFLHWRADRAAGKITPVVALGEERARIVGALLLYLIATLIILNAALQIFPWYSAIASLTILPVLTTLRRAKGDLKYYMKLMAVNTRANLQAALIIIAALLIRGLLHI